jgi:hypothetical protein
MKLFITLVIAIGCLGLLVGTNVSSESGQPAVAAAAQEQGGHTPPDVVKLALEYKLGAVSFNHTAHITQNRNLAGTGPIDCVECHHTAQPAAELAKHPPLKTAWPADRTVTLTAETVKDPKTPDVVNCRDCHARKDEKPKLLPAIPEIKHEASAAMITLTDQQAFHRNCASCHDEVMKQRPTAKAPKTAQCTICHKKAA